jgi:nucleotide-binding universal stress UspA family protein
MYGHILLPFAMDDDQGEQAVLDAAQTLLDEGGRVSLLHVVEDIPSAVAVQLSPEVLDRARESSRATLGELAQKLQTKAEVHVVDGNPGLSIVDYAKAHGVDCIIMRSHRPRFSDIFLGSTASKVVSRATCAVHVIR